MFESYFIEKIQLQNPDASGPEADFSARAIVLEQAATGVDAYAKISLARTFLVKSGNPVRPGMNLIYAGESHYVRSVKVCRDFDGRVECYRCET